MLVHTTRMRSVVGGAVVASVLGAVAAEPPRAPAFGTGPHATIGYFVDDKMVGTSDCEFLLLRSYRSNDAVLLEGGTGRTCEVDNGTKSDCLIRCGGDRGFTDTSYDVENDDTTVVLVVFTRPEILSTNAEGLSPGKFDANYERLSLYRDGRGELREYWRRLPEEVRKRVDRAYALVLSPTGSGVLQVRTWVE